VQGFFVLVTDISAIKKAELALRESEERFRLTVDEAPIGMALVGPDGRFLRVNRVLCEILGYSAQELTGTTFQAITHPEDLDADLSLSGQLARGEIARYTLEKRYIRKNGSIVDIELSASVLRGADGKPVLFISQIEDISERKRAEREQQFLAELGPVLASTLDQDEILDTVMQLATRRIADFCIVDIAGEGQMVRKKVASRDPWGREVAQALLGIRVDPGRPYLLAETISTRRPMVVRHPSDDVLAAMTQGPEHLRMVKELRMHSMIAVPLLAADRVVGAIALIASQGSREFDARDVRLAQELAWRVALALENARLYRAACEASKVRDEVLAIVAHDLRSPLNTIAMQAALLRRRAQPRAGTEATASDVIQRSAARMTRLIQDLLDVSRMEAGRLSVEGAPLDARQFLAQSVQSLQGLADAAGIELQRQAPDALPLVWADRDRLAQVLENLVGNALKFTGSGGRIAVGAQERESDVLFWVRDSGAGIPPEHLQHVFDRFWQARRTEREGAGLGLPIVKGVVESHGGRVWVESTPGEGTCFFFTIPRAEGRASVQAG
jgi:PAS domain S-box-containing protein